MSCEVPELPKAPLLKAMLAEAKYDKQKRFEDFIESLPAMKRRENHKELHLPLRHLSLLSALRTRMLRTRRDKVDKISKSEAFKAFESIVEFMGERLEMMKKEEPGDRYNKTYDALTDQCATVLVYLRQSDNAKSAQGTDEELVKPRWNYSGFPGIYYYFCGRCGSGIDEGQTYCSFCNAKQNWIAEVPKCKWRH